MLNVGLTGGIGSGKSTIDRLFSAKGAYIIDFDALTYFVEEPNRQAWKEIVEHFGKKILNADDTINRKKLGEIVFRDRKKLNKLNSIVHPVVINEWQKRIENIRKEKEDAIIISDVPLLIEIGLHNRVDIRILVYISPEEQIKRIIKRDGYSIKKAEYRLNSQMSIDDKIPYADFVINNEGPLKETSKIVDEIWEKLLEKERIIRKRYINDGGRK
ncbi:MAG: dephospho-CoA kinase [Deltaproteobacteria bacterium]|nr:MAG: dephospho-CoA kinase [Desulfobacteraceae bacterium 4484_190.3]RLB84173.1 MAG: dephospho-CoA kinase [Deltaproteobacteria bacterium]